MSEWLALFVAGGTGACMRVGLARTVDLWLAASLPNAGVLVVNVLGSLAIGALSVLVPEGTMRIAVLAGLLGGFTTYSSFALLLVELGGGGRWGMALLQGALHLIGGIAAVIVGLWLGKLLRPG
ncbi:MAG: CrcB family protein [Nannocystaceae bacterium]